MSRQFFIALATAGLLATAAVPTSGEATDCSCTQQRTGNVARTSQSGPGICSTAELRDMCSVSAIHIPQAGREGNPAFQARIRNAKELQEMLRSHGIDSDPVAAVTTAGTVPPEDWQPEQFESVAVVLFALSQTDMPQERIKAIAEILGVNRDEILPAFTGEASKTEATQLNLRDFALSVSYGCIELLRGDFTARIRTPYSLAGNRCADLPSAPDTGRGTALPAPHPTAKHPTGRPPVR